MKPKGPSWLSSAVFYQVYPQSFCDTNGDGIGDIPGIIRKLDYIRSLGCNSLWINPCFVSPFGDAGYDVADFYTVAPRYGTNADLKRLFAEAHKRNIRVCLDLVAGHTSIEHPWFRQSCRPEPNKYSHWYVWTDNVWYSGNGDLKVINGYSPRDGNFLTNFFYFQPALNYGFAKPDPKQPWQLPVDHPHCRAVKRELIRIMRYWLDRGADGFRVDMASSLVKNDPGHRVTKALWQEIRGIFDRDYPEAALIAEWSFPKNAIPAGFHVDFMVHFGTMAWSHLFCMERHRQMVPLTDEYSFFDQNGRGDIMGFLRLYREHYRATRQKGYISLPSGNHDTLRLRLGRSVDELRVAFAFLLTMPGIPFIYYGDEIGMRYIRNLVSKEGGYNRTGSRTPMQWDASRNAGFSTAPAKRLYLPIDPAKDRPTVADQEKDPHSLLNHVRALIRLRLDSPALGADGEFTPLVAKSRTYPFVYLRTRGRERYLVALNPAARKVTAEFRLPGRTATPALKHGHGVTLTGDGHRFKATLDPVTYGIFRLE